MDEETYRRYFADPPPPARFGAAGIRGATLYFADFGAAVAYYTRVLGPPAYAEGEDTRGWRLGETWLTLLAGGSGRPLNVELPIVADSPAEAERLQAAFIAAGGSGPAPGDQLMYQPIRYCPVTDPFGTRLLVFAPLAERDRSDA